MLIIISQFIYRHFSKPRDRQRLLCNIFRPVDIETEKLLEIKDKLEKGFT